MCITGKIEESAALRVMEELVLASHRAYKRGIQTGNGGNTSVRYPEVKNRMIVKSSGGSLGDCSIDSGFVITDLIGTMISGKGKPTREAILHGLIYNLRSDVNAVMHTHSPYAIAWSLLGFEELPRLTWHSELKLKSPVKILEIPSAMVRIEDVPLIEKLFEQYPKAEAFILKGHGIVAMDENAILAEHLAEFIEETAQIAMLKYLAQK